ncbi:hypothetical protein DRE_03437 [Drechslerella stenobrocha 248]|uniref:Uncharacterized protein n=1 Tax=Drechslerella stenobrocha 248 TaxID=1043628 RepID=W7I4I1_9PEZI|nr:hypothetical protein DRE_03437 [Drechslerella stenobrocha 248]
MDPRLAQILQTLSETSAAAGPPPPPQSISQPQQGHLALLSQLQAQLQQQPSQPYDPRQVYQPDLVHHHHHHQQPPAPAPAHVPPASAPPPQAPPANTVNPRTITQWPDALKYITTVVINNPIAMDRLRKMKLHQRDHERQWWQGREAIINRHSNSSSSKLTMDSVLHVLTPSTPPREQQKLRRRTHVRRTGIGFLSLCTSAQTTNHPPRTRRPSHDQSHSEKQQELTAYDEKVHRTSTQMYASMASDLQKLDIPFFILPDAEFPGDQTALPGLKQRVVELLDDLT